MDVTVFGIMIDKRDVHFEKQTFSIEIKELEKLINARELQN
jgi:hypothetical protein